MLVVRSDAHAGHHCLELDSSEIIDSWEAPVRAEQVDAALEAAGFSDIIEPDELDRELVLRIHDEQYVEFLATAHARWVDEGHTAAAAMGFGWPTRRFRDVRPTGLAAQLGYYSFAADCSIAEHTWLAVTTSAACAQTAATRLASGEDRVVFARCRPPGHHAMRDQFGGYCYLNNAAIAAQRLRDSGMERVAVLDVDYHHGNGTQDIFYDRDDVWFCSVHADPAVEFPYYLGYGDEHGAGAGDGANLNLPLPHRTGGEAWFAALDQGIEWLMGGSPDAVVVSLGVDTFERDPISQFRLESGDFVTLGERLTALDRPTVLVLEGGYATDELGHNVVSVLSQF